MNNFDEIDDEKFINNINDIELKFPSDSEFDIERNSGIVSFRMLKNGAYALVGKKTIISNGRESIIGYLKDKSDNLYKTWLVPKLADLNNKLPIYFQTNGLKASKMNPGRSYFDIVICG